MTRFECYKCAMIGKRTEVVSAGKLDLPTKCPGCGWDNANRFHWDSRDYMIGRHVAIVFSNDYVHSEGTFAFTLCTVEGWQLIKGGIDQSGHQLVECLYDVRLRNGSTRRVTNWVAHTDYPGAMTIEKFKEKYPNGKGCKSFEEASQAANDAAHKGQHDPWVMKNAEGDYFIAMGDLAAARVCLAQMS